MGKTYTLLIKVMLSLCLVMTGSKAWADSGVIKFGSATGSTSINSASVTGNDNLGNTWTITTVGTTSFTPNASYAQVGSGSKPATSITMTTTLPSSCSVTSFSAKFGGFNGTGGNVTLKVGETTVGSGSLSASTDVTVSSTSSATGQILTVTVTNISKGVKAYEINYTITSGSLTYSVTYDGNGSTSGSVPEDENKYENNATVTVLGNTGNLAKTGYTYDGWNTKADGTGAGYTVGNEFTITENTTLYAKWNVNKYNVSIASVNGVSLHAEFGTNGTIGEGENDNIDYGTTLSLIADVDPGYAFDAWKVTDGDDNDVTVNVISGNELIVPAYDITISANVHEIPKHTVTFSVDGNTSRTATIVEGAAITFPTAVDTPTDDSEFSKNIDGKTFMGWAENAIVGTTNDEPTFVTSATMGDSDVTYYAVYANKETSQGLIDKTLTILPSDFNSLSGSYSEVNTTKTVEGNNYTITAQACKQNSQIQMRDNATISYIYFPTLPGNISNVSTTQCNNASGSNYNGTIHLKTSKTRGNSDTDDITKAVLSSVNSFSIDVEGDVKSFYLVTSAGLRLSDLTVSYKVSGETTIYSDYCTTVAPDTRALVNITGFNATETTIVKDNTTNTSITNNQPNWAAAYIYESDNTDVAEVNASGVITAKSKGTANITAKLNVDKNDTEYKAGDTRSMSIEITVVNPSHNVAFYDNGTHLTTYDASVEEGEVITFPADPTLAGFEFLGWATSEITTSATEAPTTVKSSNMGEADITYYAVYADVKKKSVTATFDASDISNLTESTQYERCWVENTTQIELYLSDGSRYTNGTPNTWSVTKGTDNYFNVEIPNGRITSIVTTIDKTKNSGYIINSVSDGATLGSYDDDTETQTVTVTGEISNVSCYATSSKQIRASKIVVNAIEYTVDNYFTSVENLGHVNVSFAASGYASYCSPFALDLTPTDDYAAWIVTATSGEAVTFSKITGSVPAETPFILYGKEMGGQTVSLSIATGDVTAVTGNMLKGTLQPTPITTVEGDYTNFGLSNGSFVKINNGTLPANKAYLPILTANVPTSSSAPLRIVFGDDVVTGIENIQEVSCDNVFYNMQGMRVTNPTRGLYIVNGKKVFVK